VAPKTILDESEAECAKDFRYATLARMSLSELIYHVLAASNRRFSVLDESRIDSLARQHGTVRQEPGLAQQSERHITKSTFREHSVAKER
jgi:hypothetical protein